MPFLPKHHIPGVTTATAVTLIPTVADKSSKRLAAKDAEIERLTGVVADQAAKLKEAQDQDLLQHKEVADLKAEIKVREEVDKVLNRD